MKPDIIDALWDVIEQRAQSADEKRSYVRSLIYHEKGIDKSLEKVGEEAIEYVIAVKNADDNRIIEEAADLLFHLMVSLKAAGISFEEVKKELAARRAKMELHEPTLQD
ncbi:MAG: phosphoribosyl-ATP diphosphatase [Methanocalculus sp. MSAO_Arc2]|uniref:phosphoribosyl-ATP diphosphatase n=1 Tax=Methanocalculus sp. MSAO_Arc2 TaxID=2293855 RepID=UPI000FF3DB5D|nr:MAG: phosphoribosyl-ATP diphosphatase [Methanocalculus sp. MSAO_Arc2]